MVPNGVASGRPPANGLPPFAVWHTIQSPSATTRAPASFVCASNDDAAGGLIGAMAGFHTSNATTISAATMTTPPNVSNLDLRVIHAPVGEILNQSRRTRHAVRQSHR